MSEASLPVALIGLGATGTAIGKALVDRGEADRLTAAVDADPAKLGRALDDFVPGAPAVETLGTVEDLADVGAGIAALTTSSHVAEVAPLIEVLLGKGYHVVGLCEELSFPWRSAPEVAERLDRAARAADRAVLGTGANPGFVMDLLPVLASTALLGVEAIEVERTADLSGFGPLLAKFGFGLEPDEFRRRLGDEVVGHIGFEQTLAQLCDTFGIEDPVLDIGLPEPILVVSEARAGEFVEVGPGTVAAVAQTAEASGDGLRITLRERFGILRPEDGIEPHDVVRATLGDDRIEFSIAGLDSKRTTIAVLTNSLDALAAAPPGLRRMGDLAIRKVASRPRSRQTTI